MNEVKSIESFSTNDGFDIFYDRNDEDIPDGLWQAEVQFPEDTEEFYHADDRFYFNVPAIWLDDNGMRKLDKYVKEGSIGTHENGVACVEYEYDGMTAESPYKIGDVMHSGGTNLIPYRGDVLLNIVTDALVIVGGIGFMVILDVGRCRGNFRKMTFHTKVVLTTTAVLLFGGAALLQITDHLDFMTAFFQSMTARTHPKKSSISCRPRRPA